MTVLNTDYWAHTSELLLSHKILKMNQINVLKTAIFMFKLHKAEVPAYFIKMF